jgi:hypothetical protein
MKDQKEGAEIRGPGIAQTPAQPGGQPADQPAKSPEPKQEQAGDVVQRYQQRLQDQAALKATAAQDSAGAPAASGAALGTTPQVEVYPLTTVDGQAVVRVLQELLPDAKVSVDPHTNKLVVLASPGKQAEIKSLLTQLDSVSLATEGATVRVLSPDSVVLREDLDLAFRGLAKGAVRHGDLAAPGPGISGPGPGVVLGDKQVMRTWLTGLASLDVNLPERGTPYLFTTPGGDIEITGWEVSQDVLSRGGSTGAVAVVLVVVLGMVRLARRGALRWLDRPAGRILLVCLGVLALLTGFLAAAALLLGAGVILLLRALLTPSAYPTPEVPGD